MQTADQKPDLSFPKSRKLCGDKAIGILFAKGQAFTKHPFRVVYLPLRADELRPGEAPLRMMISVGKKRFKRAVKRNRVKRQTREAWRKSKHVVEDAIAAHPAIQGLHVALIFCGDGLPLSADVDRAIDKATSKLALIINETAL